METKDMIPVVAVGGALALIVYLAGKNKTAADNVVMPYGWGSFQSGNNPITPVTPSPTPTPTPTPTPKPRAGIEPWNGPPWNGDWQNYIKWGGNWEAYQTWVRGNASPTSVPAPRNQINMVPVVAKATSRFTFSGADYKKMVRPVRGKGVI